MTTPIERQTMRKVYLRDVFAAHLRFYLICYLDRVNIGFAAAGDEPSTSGPPAPTCPAGLGAGAFFWGYFLLEVPSNLILERVGARRWITRIMITWGIVSGCFAFVQGPISFFTLRFLLEIWPRPASSPA